MQINDVLKKNAHDLNERTIQLNAPHRLFKISKICTLRNAFHSADFESVLKILLSLKVSDQIGS